MVVLVPRTNPTDEPDSYTVNGRVARLIAWLLYHRVQIEQMRGALAFNLGPRSFQAEIRETFPSTPAAPSLAGTVTQTTETFPEEATDSN